MHLDDADQLVAARGRGLYFTPEALAGAGLAAPDPVDRLAWGAHPLLWPFATADVASVRFHAPPDERTTWTHALDGIERELMEGRSGHRQAALAHLVILLVAATRLVEPAGPEHRPRSELLDQVLAGIERGFRGHLTLSDVASSLHVSSGHLTSSVHELTGRTGQEWIAEPRMTEARRLLVETGLPVQEIGRQVGYPDPGYFARVFKRAHGLTPRVWRAATRVHA